MLPMERFATLRIFLAVGARLARLRGTIKFARQIPADHRVNKPRAIEIAVSIRRHDLAVSQHRDPVREGERLLERVTDENDRHAIPLEPADEIEEVKLLFGREARGRLVENQDARMMVDGAGDLHHLLLARAERRDERHRVDIEVERKQEALRLDVEAPEPVEELFLAEIDVLRHGHRRDEIGLLEDHGDPSRQRFGGRFEVQRLSVEDHFAGSQFIDAGQYFHQRRFACAVLSDDCMDLASAQRKVDVLDCRNAAERLGRLTELEDAGS